jgi:hypothetical protein
MRRSTAFLTVAALAIGGLALQPQVFSQQNPNQNNTSGTTGGHEGITGSSRVGHDQTAGESGRHMGEVKGVQDLFARATDAAVSENGMSQLTGLFANREGMEGHEREGAGRGGLSGTASDRSSGLGQSSTSSDRARTSGTTGTESSRTGTESSRTGAGETAGSPRTGSRAGATASGAAENQQLTQIVQQIRQEWKQKYNQDFRITNESVVYSDITAADIGMREAQPAGGELRGTNSGASGESRDLNGDRRGSSSGSSGLSGSSAGTGTSSSGTGSSATGSNADRSGSYSKNDRTSSSASGSASTDSQRSSRTGSSDLSGSAQQAGEREMHHPITVNVPAVRGTQPVQVHLMREGSEFKFASHGQIDQQKLAQALEKHLGEVQSSKSDWPTDVNQGYRLVTQHVLMAINEASGHMGESGDHAQPAGSRIHGTSGSTGTSSDINRSSGGSSNTTGTGSNQNR